MELVVKCFKYKDKIKDLDFTFRGGCLTGLVGNNSKYLLEIINGSYFCDSGVISLDEESLDRNFYKKNPSFIAYISNKPRFYSNKVLDEFKFTIKYRKYKNDIVDKKIINMLKLVGLDESYLKRNFVTLSLSEKILISIAISLVFDPKVVMFGDVFSYLDFQLQKKVIGIIRSLKDSGKIVIIQSSDVNLLYQYTDKIIIFDNNEVLKSGDTFKVYTNQEILKNEKIDKPSVALITMIAKKKKKVNLTYQREVRDIIKDIYKHV